MKIWGPLNGINAQQNISSIQKKIPVVLGLRKSPYINTNNICLNVVQTFFSSIVFLPFSSPFFFYSVDQIFSFSEYIPPFPSLFLFSFVHPKQYQPISEYKIFALSALGSVDDQYLDNRHYCD